MGRVINLLFFCLQNTIFKVPEAVSLNAIWEAYCINFNTHVKPKIEALSEGLANKPLISVVVPVFNTNEAFLADMIASVRAQIYENWELILVDDASTNPKTLAMLKAFAAIEPKIKVLSNSVNNGVSQATNNGINAANGTYIALLDHDDILQPQALYRLVESVVDDEPDVIYSDELVMDSTGSNIVLYALRPAYSKELFLHHQYIVHLVCFRRSLALEIGGVNEDYKISQDYDFLLRLFERSQKIVHIPEILYRWRLHNSSEGHKQQNNVMRVSTEILENYFQRVGTKVSFTKSRAFNFHEHEYALDRNQKVAIIIPTKNNYVLLKTCIDSILATVNIAKTDIYIVDHASDDPETLAYLNSVSGNIQVIKYSGNFNFSKINNWAINTISDKYDFYCFCNNDIEAFQDGWLDQMLKVFSNESVGAVGALLYYPDKCTIQHGGVCVGAFGAAEHYGKFYKRGGAFHDFGYYGAYEFNHEVSAVTAACMVVKSTAFSEVAGFDETIEVGFGDVDLCLKMRSAGYLVIMCPNAKLVHHESKTRGILNDHLDDTKRFLEKWKVYMENGDPYFNPGFDLFDTNWRIKHDLAPSVSVIRRVYEVKANRSFIGFSPVNNQATS